MTNIVEANKITEFLGELTLPKWPQMRVWGKRVNQAQAEDIILRTDPFMTEVSEYSGGNNNEWTEFARELLGFGPYLAESENYERKYKLTAALREAIGFVPLDYVHNTWASSAFVYGPYGFCSPSGDIWYHHNVGKWPAASEVYEDWEKLATAFPYLDLTVTLMSGEQCEEEAKPVVTFRVKDGQVHVLETPVDLPPEFQRPVPSMTDAILNIGRGGREQGLPADMMMRYGERISKLVAELGPTL